MAKFVAEIEGRERVVELRMHEGRPSFTVNGNPLDAEAVETEPGVFSILCGGRSFEVRVTARGQGYQVCIAGRARPYQVTLRDPRRRRGSGTALGGEGRQEIASPMPGKVVRVMVEEQQSVEAGQGLLVVEAMKMQNEIKSPKAGVVARVLTRAGAAINAGETLLVVE